MPKLNDMFPSNYLKAVEIEDDLPVTIHSIKQEQIGDDEKFIVYFNELDKGLVLNKTNAETISQVVGSDDTDDWPGHSITLFVTTVTFQGKPTEAIRIKLRKPKPGKSGKPTEPDKPMPQRKSAAASGVITHEHDDSDVPF